MCLLCIQAERRSILRLVRHGRLPIDLSHKLLRETEAEGRPPSRLGMANGWG